MKTESSKCSSPQLNDNSDSLPTPNTQEENNTDQNAEDDIFGTESQQENNKKRRKRKKKKSKKTKAETAEINPVINNEESTKLVHQVSNNDQLMTKRSKRRWKRKGPKRDHLEKENSRNEENVELSKSDVDFIHNNFLSHFVFWAFTIFLAINYLFNQSD